MENNNETKVQGLKQWTKIKGENSWTMFKVIAEFVEAFERMNHIRPSVSIFGSARTKPEQKYYKLSVEMAKRLTDEGYGVITGGFLLNKIIILGLIQSIIWISVISLLEK